MSEYDLKWSPGEKKIARKAYELAYQREMEDIKKEIERRIANLKENQDIWALEDFLYDRRQEMAEKYDYRYSVLMIVFMRLVREGYLKEEDLKGLAEDKITRIKQSSENFQRK